MDHQDWNPVVFNAVRENRPPKPPKPPKPPEETTMEAPKLLGQLIGQARTAKGKKRKQFAADMGVTEAVMARWETDKEKPTNEDLAKMEKILGVKLPRNKKVKVEPLV